MQGHTDTMGTPASNIILSNGRAAAVVKSLVSRGVDRRRLRSKGYGQTMPIAANATEAGRALKRRVQFIILEKTPTPPR